MKHLTLLLLILLSLQLPSAFSQPTKKTTATPPKKTAPASTATSNSKETSASTVAQFAAATQRKMTVMLMTVELNGNKDNDYLVQMMQLNHQAVTIASNQPDIPLAELKKQEKNFNEASNLLTKIADKNKIEAAPSPTPQSTSIITTAPKTKKLEEVNFEIKKLSQEYVASGDGEPAIVSFALKVAEATK